MLTFVDQSKNIRLFRVGQDPDGKRKREKVGVIWKHNLQASPETEAALTAEENVELKDLIEFYKKAAISKNCNAALTLPETLSEVLSYLETSATDVEKRVVIACLLEAVRAIKKIGLGAPPVT